MSGATSTSYAGSAGTVDPSVREIAQMLNREAASVAAALFPNGVVAGKFFCIGSVHGEAGSSLKIDVKGLHMGRWADYQCDPNEVGGKGDMLKLVELALGTDVGGAVKWAKGYLGISSMDPRQFERLKVRAEAAQQRREVQSADEVAKSRFKARNMWLSGVSIVGTPAMRYLAERGIDFARIGRIPGALRFRHDVWHAERRCGLPALLTMASSLDGKHMATHATYLEREATGRWGKLPNMVIDGRRVKVAKKIFGQAYFGAHWPIHRGRTQKRLREIVPGEVVHVSEGLEDALTHAMIWPESRVVMAGVLGNIGQLELPRAAGDLVVLAQRDEPGSPAALSFESQIKAQQRVAKLQGVNRRVLCKWPGDGFKDLNDELRGVAM